MVDFKVITPKRDIARELARKYSTMTYDELDVVEDILEPIKYGKGEMILPERPNFSLAKHKERQGFLKEPLPFFSYHHKKHK